MVCTCLLCSLAFAICFVASLPLVLAQLVVVVLCRHARVRWSDWISRDDSRSSLSSDRDAQGHVIPLSCLIWKSISSPLIYAGRNKAGSVRPASILSIITISWIIVFTRQADSIAWTPKVCAFLNPSTEMENQRQETFKLVWRPFGYLLT